ncbi:hypothetical protein VTH8203_01556 [Vibrio thalassae]|uniref:Uncharacterized protein n=1 Tax=Vibrio thalassae TaxID=1243014 RepID=A0A240EHG2_9VIBR|nr:hypothetical protein VTH8203_01556 [Vibrio thalassae]
MHVGRGVLTGTSTIAVRGLPRQLKRHQPHAQKAAAVIVSTLSELIRENDVRAMRGF